MRTSRFVIVGLGNIGRRFLRIVQSKQETLRDKYGLQLVPVAAVDSSGAAVSESGLDIGELVRLKEARQGVAGYAGTGRAGAQALEVLQAVDADLLIELSPTNLQHGEPGLSAITWALSNGRDVVTANKGPLVLAYQKLMDLAERNERLLFFSGAVAGGLPTVNIGRRDLVGATVKRVEGVFNTTTNYILTRMAEDNLPFADALHEAQQAGVAEADPTLDIDGWDTANKLVIVANSVLGVPTVISDVSVSGIRNMQQDALLKAKQEGKAIRLLATAESRGDGGYDLAVRPQELPLSHPLARLKKWEMAVVYYTDVMGTITAIIEDEGPTATAAAVQRDVINLLRSRS